MTIGTRLRRGWGYLPPFQCIPDGGGGPIRCSDWYGLCTRRAVLWNEEYETNELETRGSEGEERPRMVLITSSWPRITLTPATAPGGLLGWHPLDFPHAAMSSMQFLADVVSKHFTSHMALGVVGLQKVARGWGDGPGGGVVWCRAGLGGVVRSGTTLFWNGMPMNECAAYRTEERHARHASRARATGVNGIPRSTTSLSAPEQAPRGRTHLVTTSTWPSSNECGRPSKPNTPMVWPCRFVSRVRSRHWAGGSTEGPQYDCTSGTSWTSAMYM